MDPLDEFLGAPEPAVTPGLGELPHYTWSDFFSKAPPGVKCTVESATVSRAPNYRTFIFPELTLYCAHERCEGDRQFKCRVADFSLKVRPQTWQMEWVSFVCCNCRATERFFAVGTYVFEDGVAYAFKVGEMPRFGRRLAPKLVSLFRADLDLLVKGRRAELEGLGIGAYTYYRRVVESQRNRLFDEAIKVAREMGENDAIVQLEAAKNERQFSKSLDLVKQAIPEALFINGENPFTLLHSPLSEGLHGWSDEECLQAATAIRTVLEAFAVRAQSVMQERRELEGAVAQLKRASKHASDLP